MEIANLTKLNKKELIDLVNDKYINTRIWLSERGEKALFLGVGLGVFIAIFYKLAIGALVLAAVAGALLWHLAPDDARDLAHARGVETDFGKKAGQNAEVAKGSDSDAPKADSDKSDEKLEKPQSANDDNDEVKEELSSTEAELDAEETETMEVKIQEHEEDGEGSSSAAKAGDDTQDEVKDEPGAEDEKEAAAKATEVKKDSKADKKGDSKNGKSGKDTETLEIKLD